MTESKRKEIGMSRRSLALGRSTVGMILSVVMAHISQLMADSKGKEIGRPNGQHDVGAKKTTYN